MVVRERRRVASLARIASTLDEKVQDAEKRLVISEAALRSCDQERRQDIADLEERQQHQILSLVEMVNKSSEYATDEENCSAANFQKKLLVLANERVSV